MKNLGALIIMISIAMGIVPPKEGVFPEGVLENLRNQGIGDVYGDPGWMKKIADLKSQNLRNIQTEFNLPVLLGKYSGSTTYFNASNFDELLFGNNPTGSLIDYYDEISYGQFQMDGIVSGWYQSSLTQSQAVENVRQYVAEIASLADSYLDYGQFDNDGPDNIPNSGDDDGYVDGIAVVYPGCLSGSDNLWAHQSSLGNNYAYVTNDQRPNGEYIIVNSYIVCPEVDGQPNCNTSRICTIGLYAHEFGHIIGLPDLYDRDESNGDSEGLGNWCLMAAANYLGDNGDTPGHMSSWCKIEMGWIDPVISNSMETNVQIAQLATSPTAIKIWEDDYRSSRYFLIENRQPVGFDTYLPGNGLMIYHINENRTAGFNSFGPNNDDENNKLVDLEAADGEHDLDDNNNRGDGGDPFPGTSGNVNFNDNTNPSSNRNNGYQTGVSINNISDPDSLMFADITPMENSGYAIIYDEYGIGLSGLSIGTNEQWVGVRFTPDIEGYLTEIDFGLVSEQMWNTDELNWEVRLYDSFDGVSPGNMIDAVSGSSYSGGWHTVQLDSMEILPNQDFFIGVKFEDNGYVIGYDNMGDFSGRSYYSSNDNSFSGMPSNYGDCNIRAKISTETFVRIKPNNYMPTQITLHPNYPNPFNPTTQISFSIDKISKVILEIYDIKGMYICTLIDDEYNAGIHETYWDASKYSSGVYFVRLSDGNSHLTQKLMLIK